VHSEGFAGADSDWNPPIGDKELQCDVSLFRFGQHSHSHLQNSWSKLRSLGQLCETTCTPIIPLLISQAVLFKNPSI